MGVGLAVSFPFFLFSAIFFQLTRSGVDFTALRERTVIYVRLLLFMCFGNYVVKGFIERKVFLRKRNYL